MADQPMLAEYLIGIDHTGRHVVDGGEATRAIARTERAPMATAACRARVLLATAWGEYRRDHPIIATDPRLCQHCAWTAALATGQVDAELAAVTPDRLAAEVMSRQLIDPLLVTRVCQAILAEATETYLADGEPDEQLIDLLAHVTAHRPVLLLGEDCCEDACDHRSGSECADDGLLACPACSLQAGGWAGEWQGQYRRECTIAAPCEVLRAVAASFAVAA